MDSPFRPAVRAPRRTRDSLFRTSRLRVLARLWRARRWMVPVAFFGVVGFLVQSTTCVLWAAAATATGAVAQASYALGRDPTVTSRNRRLAAVQASIEGAAHREAAQCCTSAKLMTDDAAPSPLHLAALHFTHSGPVLSAARSAIVRVDTDLPGLAYWSSSGRVPPYHARTARLLI